MSERELKDIFEEDVVEKIYQNPLRNFLQQLGSLYIQRSQQDLDRMAQKEKLVREIREQNRLFIAKPVESLPPQHLPAQNVAAGSHARYPSTLPSTPQKRNASEASLDPQWTHTTPTKLVKPEAVV